MIPPPDDEGDGRHHSDAQLRRPRWTHRRLLGTTTALSSMTAWIVALYRLAHLAPSSPMSHRRADDVTSSSGRSRSRRGSHPSDADSERASQGPTVAQNPASPSHIGSHPSDADSERSRPTCSNHSRTSTELRPNGIHSSDADSERTQQPSNVLDNGAISSTVSFESDRSGTVLTTAAALRLEQELDKLTTELGKMFACVTKIAKRKDPVLADTGQGLSTHATYPRRRAQVLQGVACSRKLARPYFRAGLFPLALGEV